MRHSIWTFLLVLACTGEKTTPIVTTDDTSTSEPSASEPQPAEEQGTDEDGDGFTIEEGDCDDTSPWVNPAMDEEPEDGIDNDCDGRTDEEWGGVTVSHINPDGHSSIETIDVIGNLDDVVTLNKDCAPLYPEYEQEPAPPVPGFLDHGIDGGWIISDGFVSLSEIDEQGNCNRIVDFTIDPANPEEPPMNPFVYGVITHPDGYYLASRIDSLIKVERDGTVTELASWSIDPGAEEGYDITVWTIARNILNGKVGLFGRYGGFATWSEEEGFVVHKRADVEAWDGLVLNSGAVKDGGGWFAIVSDTNPDSPTAGEISIRRFNFSEGDWENRITWSDSNSGAQEFATPFGLTVNGDSGDYYVTATVASLYTVWRIREADNLIADLYNSGFGFAGHQLIGRVLISNRRHPCPDINGHRPFWKKY